MSDQARITVPTWLYHRDGSSSLFREQAPCDAALTSGDWADSPANWTDTKIPSNGPRPDEGSEAAAIDKLRERLAVAGVSFHPRHGLASLTALAEKAGIAV